MASGATYGKAVGGTSAAGTRHAKKPENARRQWFDWHSIIGVLGGLLLFVICWSGSFATISHELDWLLNPAMRASDTGAGAPQQTDFAATFALVRQQVPDATVVRITRGLNSAFLTDVVIRTPDKKQKHLYVDTAAGRIVGSAHWLNNARFFRDFHMNFYGFFFVGKYLVCLFAIPLLGSLITGLFFYKRWWRRFFDLRTGKGARTFWSSAHKLAGLWAIWFVLLIGATGVWYLFEATRLDLLDGKFAYTDTQELAINPLPKIKRDGQLSPTDFAQIVDMAQQARPDLNINRVTLNRGGYVYIIGQAGHMLVRNRANKLFIDPTTGTIVYNQHAGQLDAYWRWSNTADPLHFGNFGGLVTKLIWFVFGLLLCGLSLSGAWLHLKRHQKKHKGHARKGTVWATRLSVAVVVITLLHAVLRIPAFGPPGGGLLNLQGVHPATGIFMLVWTAVTVGICLYWAWCVRRLQSAT